MPRDPRDISDSTLALLLADGLGPVTLRKLRDRFTSDDAAAGASITELMEIPGIGRQTADALRRSLDDADVAAQRQAMHGCDVHVILIGDADYPSLLATIDSAPPALWIRGSLQAADDFSIAIVGSRRCTPYGREQAARMATMLSQAGLTIVSGGALGVDSEAHRAALRVNGRTIAVLGCGLDIDYPREHGELFAQIARSSARNATDSDDSAGATSRAASKSGGGGGGAVISEFAMGTQPRAENFPRRNRIISGLSLGVLVIEAAARSGALITARKAAEEHHREVMALPGRVDSPTSMGCLQAIREGWAAMVTSHTDVLEQLDGARHLLAGARERQSGETDARLFASRDGNESATDVSHDDPDAAGEAQTQSMAEMNLTATQQRIIAALRDIGRVARSEELSAATGLAMHQLLADLTMLEIRGLARKDPTGGVRLVGKSRRQ